MKVIQVNEERMLFDLDLYQSEHPSAISKRAKGHVWTEKKAHLVARYLRSFTYVTKHGTYIDVFAGPQVEKSYENWAAKPRFGKRT